MRGRARARLRAASILLAAALAACDSSGFDPQVWRAEKGDYDGDSRRSAMLPELLDARLKTGTSRADVLALLGEPDSGAGMTLVYYLGRSAYGVSYETLEIMFDAEGRLVSAAMRRS